MTADRPATGQKPKSQTKIEREERLSKALRDNLAKRKAQSRARASDISRKKLSS